MKSLFLSSACEHGSSFGQFSFFCKVSQMPNFWLTKLADSFVQIFDIIGYIYQYLKLLRQIPPQEWIFKELQDIANIDFRFAEEEPQDDYAAELAENMLKYPPEHVICGDYLYKVWDKEIIKHILSYFSPENMRIDMASKSFSASKGRRSVQQISNPFLL